MPHGLMYTVVYVGWYVESLEFENERSTEGTQDQSASLL